MAGYKNFQVKRNKNSKSMGLLSRNKNYNKSSDNLSKSSRLMQGIGKWTSFYRANPHRFVKDYLGINLKLFQMILIFMMEYSYYFMYIASRSQGKTFLAAIFCCVRAILYPGTKIVVASG
ncbi:hypothetical protein GCM10008931_42920 [Oceanobacillus oncorhynchi subsp. oncorhynchi]|uniref:hypothetical protein n=1 Tax=Oceanobacillus oncorhynchi TaxID=545501 RepID=UPI0031D4F2D3